MATLSVGGTTVFDGATLQSASLASATFPAGHIVQAHAVEYDDVVSSTTLNAWTVLTGMSLPFTPVYNNSKIHGHFSFAWGTATQDTIVGFRILRVVSGQSDVVMHEHGSTTGGAATFRGQTMGLRAHHDSNGGNHNNLAFFDTPGTDILCTYTLEMYRTQAGTTYINRTHSDSASYGRGSSVMSCMEIKV
jgi:hypothetical protein